jgi:hypothetical protein
VLINLDDSVSIVEKKKRYKKELLKASEDNAKSDIELAQEAAQRKRTKTPTTLLSMVCRTG